jgi:hypothetical protein
VEHDIGGPIEQRTQLAHERTRVRLREVALQRVVVRPFLDEHVALGLLEIGVYAVAATAVLLTRATTHLGRNRGEALAVLRGHVDSAGDDDHARNPTRRSGSLVKLRDRREVVMLQEMLARRSALAIALIAMAMLPALPSAGAGAHSAVVRIASASCPGTFQVLRNDRVGSLKLPAGPYTITPAGGLSCAAASTLLNRFLQDWDGVLPNRWKVGTGGFQQGAGPVGFSVKPARAVAPNPPPSGGQTCAGSFTLTGPDQILNLELAAGNYSVQLLSQSPLLSCATAFREFSNFLHGNAETPLPSPWTLDAGASTFSRGGGVGFRVLQIGGGTSGGGRTVGFVCPGTFRILHNDQINSLKVKAGSYYLYAIGSLTCKQVANDLALDLAKNRIPPNWTLNAQTATFLFRTTRGFRVEPVGGV